MATDDTEAAPVAAVAVESKSRSLLKAAGTTIGLFLMLLATQLSAPILGCKLLNSATPNCPAPVPEAVVKKDGKHIEAPVMGRRLDQCSKLDAAQWRQELRHVGDHLFLGWDERLVLADPSVQGR